MTLSRFDSIVLVTITVTRKIFTMVLSVIAFGHHMSTGQWASVALVFAGIGLEAAERQFRRKEGKLKEH